MKSGLNPKKIYLASLFARTGLGRVSLKSLGIRHRQAYIRAINYHGTSKEYAENFARHLEFYSRNFVPAGLTELETLLSGKPWPYSKPGLIISLDDGLRNNFDVAAPLLEKHNFVGWFMVPAGFVDCAPSEQRIYAQKHGINVPARIASDRIAMSWDELSILSRRHVIACHTNSHHRLNSFTAPSQFVQEIVESKKLMENRIEKDVNVFCWVGGEEDSYSAEAARHVKDAGYAWSFMTNSHPISRFTNPMQLQRTNIEANWPLELVAFQVCGFIDLVYRPKRRRINRLTNL